MGKEIMKEFMVRTLLLINEKIFISFSDYPLKLLIKGGKKPFCLGRRLLCI